MGVERLVFYSDSGEPVALEGFINDITEINHRMVGHQA
jgi:hypothetical protein